LKFLISQNFSEINEPEVKISIPKSVNTIILLEATEQMEEYDLIKRMQKILDKVVSNIEKEIEN
jgi:hypothetical protein